MENSGFTLEHQVAEHKQVRDEAALILEEAELLMTQGNYESAKVKITEAKKKLRRPIGSGTNGPTHK